MDIIATIDYNGHQIMVKGLESKISIEYDGKVVSRKKFITRDKYWFQVYEKGEYVDYEIEVEYTPEGFIVKAYRNNVQIFSKNRFF
jgi:hypothetical protein